MVAVSESDGAAIAGNCIAAVEAVGRGVVIFVLSDRAYSAFVKTGDLDGTAVCKGVFFGRCSVCAYSNRCRITRYVVCFYGIYAGVSTGDVENEIESLVLITLITVLFLSP